MAYTTIKKPSDYFNTVLYTGNGSTQSITGVGFQPDFTWIKNRSSAYSNCLYDVARTATKRLKSNSTDAEDTDTNGLTAFDLDGFSVGSSASQNASGENIVSWNWLANNTSGSSNTDGSITSTVSANTTSGFSIVSYTGTGSNATVGHGLGAVPKMIIVKRRNTAENWAVNIQKITNVINDSLWLNLTNASSTIPIWWNSTNQTSSVFSIGTASDVNGSGDTYIAYCFAEKQGFSKFGSYTGNGNADGTFVYTGFSPSFVMHKRTDTTNNWIIQDNKRVGYNADNRILKANLPDAEQGVHEMDFVSNGFKIRTTGAGSNASGGTYIYMAFAEEPLVGDNPATAR